MATVNDVDIKLMVDKKFYRVEQVGEAIHFENDKDLFIMNHHSDCCEDQTKTPRSTLRCLAMCLIALLGLFLNLLRLKGM